MSCPRAPDVLSPTSHYFGYDGFIFFFLRAVDAVVEVFSRYGSVCGYGDDVEFVYIPELAGFCLGGTCHAGELVVHAEIVLECDGCECLCGGLL